MQQQIPFLTDQHDLDYDPIGNDGATLYRVRKTLFSKKALAFLVISMLAIAGVVYVSTQKSSVAQNDALTDEVREIKNAQTEKWDEPETDFEDNATEEEVDTFVPKMKSILRKESQKNRRTMTKIQFELTRKECPICKKFDKWSAACQKCHYRTTLDDLRKLRGMKRRECGGKPGARNFDPVYCKKIKSDIRDHLRQLVAHKKYCGKAKLFRHPCHACLLKTHKPTKKPTKQPSKSPTKTPTTLRPTRSPTGKPTKSPTSKPTSPPTKQPTNKPTATPTAQPTKQPTKQPTNNPTASPTAAHLTCGKFTIITEPMTWAEANRECKHVFGVLQTRASLASIHTDKDNNLLKNCFKTNKLNKQSAAWIGFNDKKVEGKWKWNDKTRMTFLNWAKHEPNNKNKKENCAEIYTHGTKAGFWNDESCKQRRYAVCQKSAPVYKGNFHSNGRFILIPHKLNWLNGIKMCRQFYGSKANLASIHGKREQRAVGLLMKSNGVKRAQIGFTDKYSGGRMRHWVWSDGTPANYHNWASGEPNNFAKERCGEVWFHKLKDGLPTWNNLPCTFAHSHILCEKKKPHVRLPQIGRFFLLKRKVNFIHGILGCRKLLGPYANLASIHSVTENDMITTLMKKHAPKHDALIGLEDTHKWYSWSFRWAWSDGTRFNFKKWAKGEPNNWKKERCGEVWIRSKNTKFKFGYWNNMGCTPLRTKLYAICEKKAPHKWRVEGKALKENAEYLKLAGPGIDDEAEQEAFLERKDDPTFEAMGDLHEIVEPEVEEVTLPVAEIEEVPEEETVVEGSDETEEIDDEF